MNDSLACPIFPEWIIIPNSNDTSVFINGVVIAIVNSPFSVWAFAANLAIIIAVIKTPSLRIRSNVLLCSLAAADCLTGLIAQPAFIVWRLALHSLDCQSLMALFYLQEISYIVLIFTSYVMLIPISCDRLYALARPLQYRAVAKETKGKFYHFRSKKARYNCYHVLSLNQQAWAFCKCLCVQISAWGYEGILCSHRQLPYYAVFLRGGTCEKYSFTRNCNCARAEHERGYQATVILFGYIFGCVFKADSRPQYSLNLDNSRSKKENGFFWSCGDLTSKCDWHYSQGLRELVWILNYKTGTHTGK